MPPATKSATLAPEERTTRAQDPEGVRKDILAVARDEFAAKGFSGARVDEIAARTKTSKRMIYYYFGDKEGLYLAVLEEVYSSIRSVESTLDLDSLSPQAALEALVGFTFDYQNANPDFVRLVMIENIHEARHLATSKVIQGLNVTVIESLRRIIRRGEEAGVFRKGLDAIDLHMTISALCFFNVANRATFSTIFKLDMTSLKALAVRRNQIIAVVSRYASAD